MKRLHGFIFCLALICYSKPVQSQIDVSGKWQRLSNTGPLAIEFKANGSMEVDLDNDGFSDFVSSYKLTGDTISFKDQTGQSCLDEATYKLYQTPYYMSLDLIQDDCQGRVKTTLGIWTRPNFKELIEELNNKISDDPEKAELRLSRARMYLALGKPQEARLDLDFYLKANPDDISALINRAGTRFPKDLKGVIHDCSQALDLDYTNKNAWFLRGLAKYTSGMEQEGCADFDAAIGYGFTVLRIAEENRCAIYWKKE